MARYVRCIEGHVFNAEDSTVCPKCGASISATESPKDPKDTSRTDRDASTKLKSKKTTLGVWPLAARQPRAAMALIALIGLIAYTQWANVSDWLYWEFAAEDQPPTTMKPSASSVADTPQAQPAEASPPSPASSAPNPAQENASPREPLASNEDVAQASLSESDRAAINREYGALIKFLQAERQINYASDASLPWSAPTKLAMFGDDKSTIAIDADVKAAADEGRWSADAVAMAVLLGGYESVQEDDVSAAMTQFETAVRLDCPMALLYLGLLHRMCELKHPLCDNGDGYRWLRLSAERGNANAAYKTAIFFSADSTQEERADAARFFRIALEHGDPEALDLARRAQSGDRAAMDELAEYALKPGEVPLSSAALFNARSKSNPAQVAVQLLQRASAGDNMAMLALAAMASGKEVLSLSPASQAELVRESARRGNLVAIFRLGEFLVAAEPGVQNFSEAALWFAAAIAFSERGSSARKEAMERYAEAVSKLSEGQRRTLTTLVKRIAPQALAGGL